MREFVITVNSTVDLPGEWLKERGVLVIPLKYTIEGKTYTDMQGLSPKEFFDKLRQGHMSATSQVNPEDAKEVWRPLLKEGKDVLHLGFSSSLSGTFNSMRIAREEIAQEFPDAKIKVIDTLCACLGEGLLLYKVLELKAAGTGIEQIDTWVEDNKLHVCHNVTVDDLKHLHRGGRVSKASAIVGTMIQIKPILHMDNDGTLQVIGKERGRKKSLHKIVDMAVEKSEGWDNDIVMITHGDCLEDAKYVEVLVREKLKASQVLIHNIGTVLGSHTGPGVLAVFFMGNKR